MTDSPGNRLATPVAGRTPVRLNRTPASIPLPAPGDPGDDVVTGGIEFLNLARTGQRLACIRAGHAGPRRPQISWPSRRRPIR